MKRREKAEMADTGAQSIDRAAQLLRGVGRYGVGGARLSDLVADTGLTQPTVRRILLALIRAGLLDQDEDSRRYVLGPETFALGTVAGARFGIHALALDGLARIAEESGDTAFLSVRSGGFSICLRREEGRFPIRTHVLQAGDRHPLGAGAGSLAILAALDDEEVAAVIDANASLVAARHPNFTHRTLLDLVRRTRADGYAYNPGLVVAGSCGVGIAILDEAGAPIGALSIAAVESRMAKARRPELARLLRREVATLQRLLRQGADPAPVQRRSYG